MTSQGGASDRPDGVLSILDTDLYKLTMQCAVHKYYPSVPVSYRFNNRTPHMKLSQEAFSWLETQVAKLSNLALTADELSFLQTTCGYLDHGDYLTAFLPNFRFNPSMQVDLKFNADPERPGFGDVQLDVKGLWQDTILYEIPLLALVSEAYFKFVDKDWDYDGQEEAAYDKGKRLVEGGAIFSEFGTRRRRDYETQDRVLTGLVKAHRDVWGEKPKASAPEPASPTASKIASIALPDVGSIKAAMSKVSAGKEEEREEGKKQPEPGKLSGTSNVHFAHKHGISPVGTMAHEWFMGIAAATQDYRGATQLALQLWIECFGRGTLGIALTDTFGTPAFLESFAGELPEKTRGLTEGWLRSSPLFADAFVGTRQDSGDPKRFIKLMRRFYDAHGITAKERKTVVFSDSLTVDSALTYRRLAERRNLAPSFGIGTFLTNDFAKKSDPATKSKPLNIVIKISSAAGNPAIKLSDDLGKNTGDSDTVKRVKLELGYVDEKWNGADEADRYGKGVVGEDLSDSEGDE